MLGSVIPGASMSNSTLMMPLPKSWPAKVYTRRSALTGPFYAKRNAKFVYHPLLLNFVQKGREQARAINEHPAKCKRVERLAK